jgi:hypothetical protein
VQISGQDGGDSCKSSKPQLTAKARSLRIITHGATTDHAVGHRGPKSEDARGQSHEDTIVGAHQPLCQFRESIKIPQVHDGPCLPSRMPGPSAGINASDLSNSCPRACG